VFPAYLTLCFYLPSHVATISTVSSTNVFWCSVTAESEFVALELLNLAPSEHNLVIFARNHWVHVHKFITYASEMVLSAASSVSHKCCMFVEQECDWHCTGNPLVLDSTWL